MSDRRDRPGRRLLLLAPPLLLQLLVGAVSGLPDGAPADVCTTLRPRHGSHLPQEGPAPFRLTTETAATGHGQWLVTLSGDRAFRGVLLQARGAADGHAMPLGRFEQTTGTHLLDCSGQTQSALTHSSPGARDSLQAVWSPTNVSGQVQFVATVVEDYRTWWEGVTSKPITIAGTNAFRSASLQKGSASDVEDVYSGCLTEYGCFGSPSGCEAAMECDVLFTYAAAGSAMKMGLMAKQEGHYAAVGFSEDDTMRSDGVIVCANGANGPPKVYYAYNADSGRDCEVKSEANPDGTSDLDTWEKDGYFMCSFTQELNLVIPNQKTFDLATEHFLLVATGEIDESLKLGYHGYDKKVVSAGPVDLTDTNSTLETAGVPALVKAHGSFMLIAWVGTAGIGILSAQFFRGTWVGKKVLGTDVWFTIHRSLMVLTALCTWLGFTFIVIHLGELSFDQNHSIIGFVVFLLTLLQVLGALLRPHPGTRLRPLFAWSHRFGGVAAYLLAVTALLLAQQLKQTRLPRYWFWMVVAAIVIHLIVSLLLLVIDRCLRPEQSASPQVAPHSSAAAKSGATGSPLRKALLGFYIFSSVGFVVALVTVLIVSTA